jgi:hypothetical protein
MSTSVELWPPPRTPATQAGRHAHHQARPTLHLRAGSQNAARRAGMEASRAGAAARISSRRNSNRSNSSPLVSVDATSHPDRPGVLERVKFL